MPALAETMLFDRCGSITNERWYGMVDGQRDQNLHEVDATSLDLSLVDETTSRPMRPMIIMDAEMRCVLGCEFVPDSPTEEDLDAALDRYEQRMGRAG
jgi:hypothetical protein